METGLPRWTGDNFDAEMKGRSDAIDKFPRVSGIRPQFAEGRNGFHQFGEHVGRGMGILGVGRGNRNRQWEPLRIGDHGPFPSPYLLSGIIAHISVVWPGRDTLTIDDTCGRFRWAPQDNPNGAPQSDRNPIPRAIVRPLSKPPVRGLPRRIRRGEKTPLDAPD